ncbi:MAG: winged helix-turn-helix transcriptional regulator [Synergistales bacterium]|nr:winged helix-turn-helix transcriptional regulator [Synergistales bacterium]
MVKISPGKWLSLIHRCHNAFVDSQFKDLDIGHGPRAFLMALSHHEGLTQDELSSRLWMDKTTTARAVKKLVEFGYVSKERDPLDKRYCHLYITEKGRALIPRIRQARERFTEMMTSGLSREEMDNLMELLEKVANCLIMHKEKDFQTGEDRS